MGYEIVGSGLLRRLLAVLCAMAGLHSLPAHAEPSIFLIGAYEVVAARRASNVEGGPQDATADGMIGRMVVFDRSLTWVDGSECATWSTEEASDGPVVWLEDPLLSDLQLAGSRRGSIGGQRDHLGWTVACDGRHVGAPTTLPLRSERVRVNPGNGTCANVFPAKVEELIYLGDHTRVRTSVCGNSDFVVKVPNAEGVPDLQPGTTISVGWKKEDCRALDTL